MALTIAAGCRWRRSGCVWLRRCLEASPSPLRHNIGSLYMLFLSARLLHNFYGKLIILFFSRAHKLLLFFFLSPLSISIFPLFHAPVGSAIRRDDFCCFTAYWQLSGCYWLASVASHGVTSKNYHFILWPLWLACGSGPLINKGPLLSTPAPGSRHCTQRVKWVVVHIIPPS